LRSHAVTAGVLVFLLAVAALHVFQPRVDPLETAVSYYVHGSHGWLLTLGLVALGLASLALVAALRGEGRATRASRWLLGVWGVGVLLGAAFQADPPGRWDEPPSLAGMVHGNAALAAFLALPLGAVALARGLPTDSPGQARRSLLRGLAVATALCLALFVLSLAPVFLRPGPPVLLGLSERLLLAVYSVWLIVAGSAARG
jgi:Protein of unknown function (DUF998)